MKNLEEPLYGLKTSILRQNADASDEIVSHYNSEAVARSVEINKNKT